MIASRQRAWNGISWPCQISSLAMPRWMHGKRISRDWSRSSDHDRRRDWRAVCPRANRKAVRRVGDPVELVADFQRQSDQVKLGDTQTVRGGQHYMFAPIYEAWGR